MISNEKWIDKKFYSRSTNDHPWVATYPTEKQLISAVNEKIISFEEAIAIALNKEKYYGVLYKRT